MTLTTSSNSNSHSNQMNEYLYRYGSNEMKMSIKIFVNATIEEYKSFIVTVRCISPTPKCLLFSICIFADFFSLPILRFSLKLSKAIKRFIRDHLVEYWFCRQDDIYGDVFFCSFPADVQAAGCVGSHVLSQPYLPHPLQNHHGNGSTVVT